MKSVNLNNIKVAVFDFDDTLAIHKDIEFDKHRNENEEKKLNYYLNAYNNPNSFYDKIEPCTRSEVLYDLINKLREKNIKIYCLSGMKFSFNLKAKQNFINKNYGTDIEVLSVASQNLKIEGIKLISKINNCNLNQILFVDDIEENVKKMDNIGVYSFLPEAINLIINNGENL